MNSVVNTAGVIGAGHYKNVVADVSDPQTVLNCFHTTLCVEYVQRSTNSNKYIMYLVCRRRQQPGTMKTCVAGTRCLHKAAVHASRPVPTLAATTQHH